MLAPILFVIVHVFSIRNVRRICEHFTFLGASLDTYGYVTHHETFLFVAAGKIAFTVGAVAVYLFHVEERMNHV